MSALQDRIVKLAKEGKRPKEIMGLVGTHENTVYDAIRAARKKGADIPLFSNSRTPKPLKEADRQQHYVVLPDRLHSLLQAEARRRNLTLTEAAQRLLENDLLGTVSRHG
ncbi:helix-turn-helix domain-containing protein [Sulfitobacter sp. KE29]|uniref:helix-turn-helix domain-containing protein n=1 Tax=unclassified Sulfitobacter TaxID=196795 RepID=UPI0023E16646|nr:MULTISPECIES: helix-turn-helix domain-containing protein [unclassified Sulfitobacter]MDF3420177.1 helix-turn-helix domain-containing protein [Sulfitobacter sp. Ks38]MDF3427662.1 helix-turn-helix domain-containing protein [Sulfitobacter sp. KE29]MDF3431241.1 helix-turn-helix domain-containing protein [Sulfitobacter sp. S46]MDF3446014.1 helix-turn-helix domain-containing protein [Sulfitobacter sp. KE31]MDF3550023.1 helix-turn-helix domain-containing protein [Sulfitobacter sp. KE28]